MSTEVNYISNVCVMGEKLLLNLSANLLRSTIGERRPKLGVPVVIWGSCGHLSRDFASVKNRDFLGGRAMCKICAILNRIYAHACIHFYQERGRARALLAQLFLTENLSKIVAGSQRVTSCERTLRGSKEIDPS